MSTRQEQIFTEWLDEPINNNLKVKFEIKMKNGGIDIPFCQYQVWDKDDWKEILGTIDGTTIYGKLKEIKNSFEDPTLSSWTMNNLVTNEPQLKRAKLLEKPRFPSLYQDTSHYSKCFATFELNPLCNFYVKIGAIHEVISEGCDSSYNISELVNDLVCGQFIILHGHRQSGKTTTMKFCIDEIKAKDKFEVIYVSLEDFSMKSVKGFFEELYVKLKDQLQEIHCPIPTIYECENAESRFRSLFLRTSGFNKGIVFMVDDGDVLLDNPEIGSEFLHMIREIRYYTTTFRLNGFLLIGVETILEAREYFGWKVSSSTSPFSVKHILCPMRFKKEHIVELLQMYAKERRLKNLEIKGIVQDIYEQTLGHRGLTSICLSSIESRRITTLEQWKKFSLNNLLSVILNQTHYSRIMDCIPKLSHNEKAILDHVVRYGRKGYYYKRDAKNELTTLLANGLLVDSRTIEGAVNSSFWVVLAAPILRVAILIEKANRVIINEPLPSGLPDIDWIIKCCIRNYNRENLTAPEEQNVTTRLSSEYAFQAETVTLMKSIAEAKFATHRYKVLFEVKSQDRNQQMDIVLYNDAAPKFGIQLLASNSKRDLKAHIKKAIQYKKKHQCNQMIVMRYWFHDLSGTQDLCSYFGNNDDIKVVHVIFDRMFTEAQYICKSQPVTIIKIP